MRLRSAIRLPRGLRFRERTCPTTLSSTLRSKARLAAKTRNLRPFACGPRRGAVTQVCSHLSIALPAVTYGTRFDGYRQRLGLNLQIPLRWALADKPNFNFGFRLMPYFRIGEASPAFSFGGNLGFRFGIAMPRIFTLIFGPEGRIGFASVGDSPNRENGLDAELSGMVGLESFLKRKWLFSLEMHFGHLFGTGGLPGGDFIYRTWFGFAYIFR